MKETSKSVSPRDPPKVPDPARGDLRAGCFLFLYLKFNSIHFIQFPFIMAAAHGDLRHLLPGNYKRLISEWLEEDCPSLDYGGFVVGETEGEARLLGKSNVSGSQSCVGNALIICRVLWQVCHSSMKSSPSLGARRSNRGRSSQKQTSNLRIPVQHRMARKGRRQTFSSPTLRHSARTHP